MPKSACELYSWSFVGSVNGGWHCGLAMPQGQSPKSSSVSSACRLTIAAGSLHRCSSVRWVKQCSKGRGISALDLQEPVALTPRLNCAKLLSQEASPKWRHPQPAQEASPCKCPTNVAILALTDMHWRNLHIDTEGVTRLVNLCRSMCLDSTVLLNGAVSTPPHSHKHIGTVLNADTWKAAIPAVPSLSSNRSPRA